MENKTKKIGFDLDGVILDNTTFKVEKYKEVYNQDFEDWQLSSNIIDEYVPDREMRKHIGDLASARNFTKILDKDCIEVLKRLKENGYELYIVSRRGKSDNGQKAAKESIKELDIGKYFNKIFLCESENEKINTIIDNQIDIFIDDRVGVVEGIYKKITLPLLFDNFELVQKNLIEIKYPIKQVKCFQEIEKEVLKNE